LSIDGKKYSASVDGMTAKDLAAHVQSIAKHSPGRAIQWLKKNGTISQVGKKQDPAAKQKSVGFGEKDKKIVSEYDKEWQGKSIWHSPTDEEDSAMHDSRVDYLGALKRSTVGKSLGITKIDQSSDELSFETDFATFVIRPEGSLYGYDYELSEPVIDETRKPIKTRQDLEDTLVYLNDKKPEMVNKAVRSYAKEYGEEEAKRYYGKNYRPQ
jgi:hypothetical protein